MGKDETLWTEMSNGSRNRNSKRRNRGSLTKLKKYMRRAFALIVACCTPNLEDDIGMVPQQIVGTNFIYPQDRYIGNSELLTQLLMLEARFNQQTEILKKLPRKGKTSYGAMKALFMSRYNMFSHWNLSQTCSYYVQSKHIAFCYKEMSLTIL